MHAHTRKGKTSNDEIRRRQPKKSAEDESFLCAFRTCPFFFAASLSYFSPLAQPHCTRKLRTFTSNRRFSSFLSPPSKERKERAKTLTHSRTQKTQTTNLAMRCHAIFQYPTSMRSDHTCTRRAPPPLCTPALSCMQFVYAPRERPRGCRCSPTSPLLLLSIVVRPSKSCTAQQVKKKHTHTKDLKKSLAYGYVFSSPPCFLPTPRLL